MTDPIRNRAFRGRIIAVDVERVRLPNGADCELEIVRHPGGAAVVALDARHRVCLLRQYRHVAGGWLWELPAGKRDHGEPPQTTARRELAEEAGVRAARWESLGTMWSSPGVFAEQVHLFLATELAPVEAAPEPHEVLEVHWLEFEEAVARAHDDRISDAKSVIALCRAASRLAHA